MHQIAPGIYIEDAFAGVTLGALIQPHGTVMVDAPLRAEDARAWRSSLTNLSIGSNRILVNLDAHLDRTLGSRALDSTIIAHASTAQVFRNRPSVFKGHSTDSGAEWEVSNDVFGTRWAVPDITFSDRLYLHWGGPDVILEHHPGPTLGSIWVLIPSAEVVFVGDTILNDQPPFLASANLPAWIESLELLKSSFKQFTIVSGRGGLDGKDSIHSQLNILKKILRGLNQLAKKDAPPEMTEGLISDLISMMSLPADRRKHYIQRLRHGLYYYYTQHYQALDSIQQS
ncbi:MAG TPA: MBL fold metallo-hydrolase [Anaerolineales bacterium]|jgi:glyoxylase-like metal-dependent hydrolase (beta-lactamase superfamily II)|nr:MBL fold metallo-hydrolase [Anaerolineales bacterium]